MVDYQGDTKDITILKRPHDMFIMYVTDDQGYTQGTYYTRGELQEVEKLINQVLKD